MKQARVMDKTALMRDWLSPTARFSWEELRAIRRLEFLPANLRNTFAFGLRTCGATALALYAAFFLQLDQPYWAGMAIWMVAQPTPGMAISKSFYRMVGTVVGSAMGVVLIAFFAQTPELFILALALWIGGCTVVSNLLRNFRAYGAVLAGYTAAIVSLGTIDHPNQIFYVAMARGSATIIGIACAALVTSLFARHEAKEKVMIRLREALGDAARRCAFPATGSLSERLALGKPLIVKLISLDTEIEFASAESASFRIHANGARSLVAHLFAALSAKRSLDAHLLRTGEVRDPALAAIHDAAMTLLGDAPDLIAEGKLKDLRDQMRTLRVKLALREPECAGLETACEVSSRLVIDRLEDLLRHLGRALRDWERLQGGWLWRPSLRLNFHRDQRLAWINGVRAALAMGAAGTFWIASAWSSGPGLLIQVGVACSLFSAAPRPDKAGVGFLIGGVIAALAAFLCNFYVLQDVSGFPLAAMTYGVFLLPGAMVFLDPKIGLVGLAYGVSFLAMSRPLNPMDYDVVSFLNNVIATLGGVAFGVLSYKLFIPPDPRAARCYVVQRIRLGLQRISELNPVPRYCDWQTRMYDRVNRLHDPENPSGSPTDEWLDGGLGAVNLGNDLLRLRLLLGEGKLSAPVARRLQSVLKTFSDIVKHPEPAERIVQFAVEAIAHTPPEDDPAKRRAWFRALGIMQEIEAFFVEHPRFLTPTWRK